MKYQDIKDFIRIYDTLKHVSRAILEGSDHHGHLGDITVNEEKQYVQFELIFRAWGYDNSKYIDIPFKVLSTGNGLDKFVRQEIRNFNNF